jgi:hypothetical protein
MDHVLPILWGDAKYSSSGILSPSSFRKSFKCTVIPPSYELFLTVNAWFELAAMGKSDSGDEPAKTRIRGISTKLILLLWDQCDKKSAKPSSPHFIYCEEHHAEGMTVMSERVAPRMTLGLLTLKLV